MRIINSIFALLLIAISQIVGVGQARIVIPSSDPKAENNTPQWEVQLNYTFEKLSNGYGDWQSASLDFSRKFKTRQTLYGSFLRTSRFRSRDEQATLGFYVPLNDKWAVEFEASVSPTHNTLAKWTARGRIERQFGKGWVVSAGYRRTVYNAAKVNLISLGAEKYFGNYRAAYTLYVSDLQKTGTSASHVFQFNRYYGEQVSSIGVTGGFGRELESLGNQGVLQTSVRSIALSGRHWVNRRWGINYGAALTQQGKFYLRRGLNIGFRIRF